MRKIITSPPEFVRNTQGGVLIYFAVLMPVVLGLMGLVVDLAIWNLNKRVVQNTADIAAIAAALENKRSGRQEGKKAAVGMALTNGLRLRNAGTVTARGGNPFNARSPGARRTSPDAMTVNIPPAQGPLRESRDAAEVVVTRRVPAFLSAIFIKGPITVRGRAVAVARPVDDDCRLTYRDLSDDSHRAGDERAHRRRDCENPAASDEVYPPKHGFQALNLSGQGVGNAAYGGPPPQMGANDNGLYVTSYGGSVDFDEPDDSSSMSRKGPFRAYIVE